MNQDVLQAGVLKEFFAFLVANGIKVNVSALDAALIINKVHERSWVNLINTQHQHQGKLIQGQCRS